ncbi:MAG: hypothetical protein KGR19_00785 [Acidobacteria bacterium]|nr:hypothetical protein [Acidobacteriota bacterium]
MDERIFMEPADIEAMIRTAALESLRAESPDHERDRALSRAATALDALCALSDREGTGAVWDVMAELSRAELLAFSTFAVSELADHTDYRWVDHGRSSSAGSDSGEEPAV